MTALGSVPKAHTQGEPEGTWNLEKLHLELKYLGRKLADARLQTERHTKSHYCDDISLKMSSPCVISNIT